MGILRVVVPREKWLTKMGSSVLMRKDGCGCILGFWGRAAGVPEEEMIEMYSPAQVAATLAAEGVPGKTLPPSAQAWFRLLTRRADTWERENLGVTIISSTLSWRLISVNDGLEGPDLAPLGLPDREGRLAKILEPYGVEVVFE